MVTSDCAVTQDNRNSAAQVYLMTPCSMTKGNVKITSDDEVALDTVITADCMKTRKQVLLNQYISDLSEYIKHMLEIPKEHLNKHQLH